MWWSEQLESWVPFDAQSVVVGDGEVTVRADLADAEAASVVTALGPVGFSGSAGPTVHALAAEVDQLAREVRVWRHITLPVGRSFDDSRFSPFSP